jgi:hypothetical protein
LPNHFLIIIIIIKRLIEYSIYLFNRKEKNK